MIGKLNWILHTSPTGWLRQYWTVVWSTGYTGLVVGLCQYEFGLKPTCINHALGSGLAGTESQSWAPIDVGNWHIHWVDSDPSRRTEDGIRVLKTRSESEEFLYVDTNETSECMETKEEELSLMQASSFSLINEEMFLW